MQRLKYRRANGLRWRGVLIAVTICSLTLSVATRFWAPYTSHSSSTVTSTDRRAAEPLRQHLDRDATQWVAPVAALCIVEPTAIGTRVAPARTILPTRLFSDSLYNRPPPSSPFLL